MKLPNPVFLAKLKPQNVKDPGQRGIGWYEEGDGTGSDFRWLHVQLPVITPRLAESFIGKQVLWEQTTIYEACYLATGVYRFAPTEMLIKDDRPILVASDIETLHSSHSWFRSRSHNALKTVFRAWCLDLDTGIEVGDISIIPLRK